MHDGVIAMPIRYTWEAPDRPVSLTFSAKPGPDQLAQHGLPGLHTLAKSSQPATEHRFTGNVYVLMDGGTFSAAAVFCGLVHREKRGVLVGEETGGGYYQMTAEKFAQVVLHSVPSIVVIPLRKVVTTDVRDAGIPMGRGVMPDHPVGRTIDDCLVPGTDTMLAYVVNLAGGTRN